MAFLVIGISNTAKVTQAFEDENSDQAVKFKEDLEEQGFDVSVEEFDGMTIDDIAQVITDQAADYLSQADDVIGTIH